MIDSYAGLLYSIILQTVRSGTSDLIARKDCSKSAIMSSMCSVPTEIRIASSVTPESKRSWSVSCSWVVDQGWIAKVLESPTLKEVSKCGTQSYTNLQTYLARFEINLKPSTTWLPAAAPPLTPKESTPPNPRFRYFLAVSCEGWSGRPG